MIAKFLFIIILYLVVLLTISPIIDHWFTALHPDEPYYEVFFEFMTQITVVAIVWYLVNSGIHKILKKYHMSVSAHEDTAIELISAIVLVGLQKNLLIKLRFITHWHPIRDTVFQLFRR